MGFFSRLWKGIKKVAKKIFKPIKSVFKAVGKFMNKIGIVGQIAMSFILPGIGSVLAQTFGKAVSALAGGALGSVGKAAGWILGKAGTFAKTIGQGFKTVTSAVTDFIGTTGKYVGGKLGIPGMDKMTLGEAFGKEGWGGRLSDSISKLGAEASNFWQSDLESFADRGIMTPDQKIASDLSKSTMAGKGPLKAEEIAKAVDPLDPESAYQTKMESGFELKELESFPQVETYKRGTVPDISGYTQEELEKGGYFNIQKEKAISKGIVDSTVSSEVSSAKQSLLSKGFEKLTGEKTIGEFMQAAPGKVIDYGIEEVKGLGVSKLKSAVGFGPEEYVQGPSWGGYSPQMRSQLSEAAQMGLQPIMQDAYADYVASSSLNTNPQGIYGGANNYADYFKRMAVFQGQGG
jgi:hypothetical protein